MHDSLVEFHTYLQWRILLVRHLANLHPHPTSLAKLTLHGLDVIIILQELVAKVSEHLNLFQHDPIHGELLL